LGSDLRYHREVSKMALRAIALALTIVVGAVPVVCNRCLPTCHQPATTGDSRAANNEPSCHHPDASSAPHHLGRDTTACSHEYDRVSLKTSRSTIDPRVKISIAPAALAHVAVSFEPAGRFIGRLPAAGPPGSTSHPSSLHPLRL